MENIDVVKQNLHAHARLRYKLKKAHVYVSSDGYHFIDKFDEVDANSFSADEACALEDKTYIETQLQAHPQRFHGQVNKIANFLPLRGARILDVGCGGGLFLSLLRAQGSEVTGIELNHSRLHYARLKHDLQLHDRAIEDEFWRENYSSYFDAVTLWDVIEHVNFPHATLACAAQVLRPGGFLFIDTPCRNSFYHRFGVVTYNVSFGTLPTFLNSMYSAEPYNHKQIFSTSEMRHMLASMGMDVVHLDVFHELSFPYDFYLEKMFRSRLTVRALRPLVPLFFKVFKIKNKMLVVAAKPRARNLPGSLD